jgi:hypothetical protein
VEYTSFRPTSKRIGQQGQHAEKKIQGAQYYINLMVDSQVEHLLKAEEVDVEMSAWLTRRGNKADANGRGWRWHS